MLYRIQHETKLSYSLPVYETVFEVRMAPPSDEDQTSLSYRLKTSPQAPVTSFRDGFGNRVELFNLTSPYRELTVGVTSYVRTHRRPAAERLAQAAARWHGPDAEAGADGPARPVSIDALEFLQSSPLVPRCPEIAGLVAGLDLPPDALAETLRRLMAAVRSRMSYEKDVTRARTTAGEALRLGRGVCQDFAHVTIGACRALGLPARYVSGYLAHPGEIATHAWCQVWAGDAAGWVDLDPTHDAFADDEYVLTAVGRDYHDVPPNRGLWKGRAEETMAVAVKVEPVDRVPVEWNDWYPPAFRPGGFLAGRANGQPARLIGRPRLAYPHQPPAGAGLVNQQSEQQQQQPRRRP